MYSYIIGKITNIYSNNIDLENNQIGYHINVSNPYTYKIGEEIKVFIYTHIREDENTLYGFRTYDEKELFLKLINVKGLGPKMALPLIASSIDRMILAINSEEISYLKKFPKIGEKLAKQIVLDLKGKLIGDILSINNKTDELEEVLIGLGYKKADISKNIKEIDNTQSLENQIKQALKLLMK